MEFKSGRPSQLTDEVKSVILQAIPEVIVQNQVAARARIPKQTLSTWLVRGKSDREKGIDSIFAQFSDDYYFTLTEVVKDAIAKLKSMPKSFGSLTWILEKCFREDFGSPIDVELHAKADLILELQKGMANERQEGKKMDPEGN